MSTNHTPSTSLDIATVLSLLSNPDVAAAVAAAAAAGGASPASAIPTVADYLPTVEAAARSTISRTYASYWRLLVTHLGDRRLDQVRTTDLRALANAARTGARKRRNSRGGVSAEENCVAAIRAFFRCAVEDGYLTTNPAAAVDKPRRLPSPRRALTADEYAALDDVTRRGGDDPALDVLLLRFHTETGARRGGALSLTLADLDTASLQVRLHEKGGTSRWQPVSPTLMSALVEHAATRGATAPNESVFRYRPRKGTKLGAPLTSRRYNTLTNRWHAALPWARTYGVSPHWLRHTAVTTAERISGSYGVARAFAGHAIPDDATTTYIKAGPAEVATVVARLSGEVHPLAPGT